MNVKLLIKALKYYADKNNYLPRPVYASDGGQMVAPIEEDKGAKASLALKDFETSLEIELYDE